LMKEKVQLVSLQRMRGKVTRSKSSSFWELLYLIPIELWSCSSFFNKLTDLRRPKNAHLYEFSLQIFDWRQEKFDFYYKIVVTIASSDRSKNKPGGNESMQLTGVQSFLLGVCWLQ
jgi:hypothetical protein